MSDVEILARVERRRKWSIEEKAALIAEVEAEGGGVKLVAQRHRISESLLYNWRAEGRGDCGRFLGSGGVCAAGRCGRSGHRGTGAAATIRSAIITTAC
jgi:transposase